ncbi:MAG: RsmD family RNA methyltransferase [Planctomycetaceae bacterium]|nr:RsmD family RNA methyltransferase [Planctomycetaceae bacterium]
MYQLHMRIIAGEFGGRKLLPPPSERTRPITDRAKQSLFDALGSRVAGALVLDAFAGTGSMGLECLSRGARRAVFVERDPGALLHLRKNIAALSVESRSLVLPIDAYRVAGHPSLAGPEAGELAIAFIDPPYAHTEGGPLRAKLERLIASLAANALADDGLISLRHPTKVDVDFAIPGLRIGRELTYGSMRITWLVKGPEP